MRLLLVFVVVLILAWRWRVWREARPPRRRAPAGQPKAITMVHCRQCGVHIPEQDAMVGSEGHYCCAAHRQAMEP